jgi:DNA transformation protein and related proteins
MSKQIVQAKHSAHHYIDQFSDWAKITTRPLFGAVALYRNDHVFAMAWKGSLYFKVDRGSQKEYEAANSHALSYVSKGKERALKSYWEVPADVLEDGDKLRAWAERAYQSALRAAV